MFHVFVSRKAHSECGHSFQSTLNIKPISFGLTCFLSFIIAERNMYDLSFHEDFDDDGGDALSTLPDESNAAALLSEVGLVAVKDDPTLRRRSMSTLFTLPSHRSELGGQVITEEDEEKDHSAAVVVEVEQSTDLEEQNRRGRKFDRRRKMVKKNGH